MSCSMEACKTRSELFETAHRCGLNGKAARTWVYEQMQRKTFEVDVPGQLQLFAATGEASSRGMLRAMQGEAGHGKR